MSHAPVTLSARQKLRFLNNFAEWPEHRAKLPLLVKRASSRLAGNSARAKVAGGIWGEKSFSQSLSQHLMRDAGIPFRKGMRLSVTKGLSLFTNRPFLGLQTQRAFSSSADTEEGEENEEGEEKEKEAEVPQISDEEKMKQDLDWNSLYMEGDHPDEPTAEIDPEKLLDKMLEDEEITESPDDLTVEQMETLLGKGGSADKFARWFEREDREEIDEQYQMNEPVDNKIEPWQQWVAQQPKKVFYMPDRVDGDIWSYYPPPTPHSEVYERDFGWPYFFWMWWFAWAGLLLYFGKWAMMAVYSVWLLGLATSQTAVVFFLNAWMFWLWWLLAPLFYILTLCGYDQFEWKSYDELEKMAEKRNESLWDAVTFQNAWQYIDSEQKVPNQHQTNPEVWFLTKNQNLMMLVQYILFHNMPLTKSHEILEPFAVGGGALPYFSDLALWNFKMHLSDGCLLHLSWMLVDTETSHRVGVVNMEVRQEALGLWHIERFTLENSLGDLAHLEPASPYVDYQIDVEDALWTVKSKMASDFAHVNGLYSTWGRMARHFGFQDLEMEQQASFEKYVTVLTNPDIQETLYALGAGDYEKASQNLITKRGVISGLQFLREHTEVKETEDEAIKREMLIQNRDEIARNPILGETIRTYGGRSLAEVTENDPHGTTIKSLNAFETIKYLVNMGRYNEAAAIARNSDPLIQKNLAEMLAYTWKHVLSNPKGSDPDMVATAHKLATALKNQPQDMPSKQEADRFLMMEEAYKEIVEEERVSRATAPDTLRKTWVNEGAYVEPLMNFKDKQTYP